MSPHEFQELSGPQCAEVARALVLQARAEHRLGDLGAAERSANRAVAIASTFPTGQSVELDRTRVDAVGMLGTVALWRGDDRAARKCFVAALSDAEQFLGPGDSNTAMILNSLGIVAKHSGEFDYASDCYTRALEIALRTLGPRHGLVASLHHNQAHLAYSGGDVEAAEFHARQAVECRTALLGPEHPDVAADKQLLGSILEHVSRNEAAA